MFKNMWYFLALCLLAVNAQNNNDIKSPETLAVNDSETKKVEPSKISALYIGDLLRTKPKEVLEASSSVHRPVISKQVFISPAPVAGRTFNYKAHGGHEYVETEYSHPATEGRSHVSAPEKRIGNAARGVPVNVMGHLLTLKPVRVVSADALPSARDSGAPRKSHHYPNDDCSKSGDHSYSSEEKSYVPEQRSYPRARQLAPNPEPEYRSPQSSYSEAERPGRYYSHSDPSSGTYDSKSGPSDTNTKSHSSGSYTKSKSTSTSRTVNPSRSKEKVRIVPTAVFEDGYEKNLGPAHGNQGVTVYKVKEPSSSNGPSSYSDDAGRDYPTSNYERDPKSGHREPQYEQHSSDARKPLKHSDGEGHHSSYSTTEKHSPKERPQQYAPAQYEQDRGSYEQTSYTPAEEQRYREQNKPSTNYHQGPEYAPQPKTRGQEQQKPYYQSYQAPESPVRYEAEQPSKTHSSKRHRNQHYERPSNDGRESTGYRTREPSTPEYNYPNEQQIQSSRSRKERPQSSYDAYSSPDIHTESAPSPQSYERNHPALRPSEDKQMNQYVYEATPHQTSIKHNQRSPKRQHRESSRSARSPERYVKSVIEERANSPARGNEPVIIVSRESQPHVSRSVSYSESRYNMGDNQTPKAKEQEQMQPEGRQADNMDYHQTSYKPFNSEYPASYANDQQHNAEAQYQSQTFKQPYEQPDSYEETPQQYQPHGEEQPYEQDGSREPEDSYEYQQGEQRPPKNGKNHHYISNIEGYKDTYGHNEPLTIDEDFFRKYGISKTAKVIVASAKKPNLFVADGTNIREGDHFANSEPTNDESYEPNYKSSFKEDASNESPEELGMPREIPGSFHDLVDTNPRFLRKLPQIMKPSSGFFSTDNSDDSFDDVEFRDAGEQKGFIVAQGPREIIQQHGDGVSRILFNIPKDESKSESSNVPKVSYEDQNGEKLDSSATKVVEKLIKPES